MRALVAVLLGLAALLSLTPAAFADHDATQYRVNAGGPSLAGTPGWTADSALEPSPYGNGVETGNKTTTTLAPVDTSHSSVPAGTPMEIFQTERWDTAAMPKLTYAFPVTAGQYEVRLYFAETYTGTMAVGSRIFDVAVEGTTVLDNYDVYAEVGANKGVVKSFTVTSDASLGVEFGHVVENPAIKAIEVRKVGTSHTGLGPSVSSLDFGAVATGATKRKTVTLTNDAPAGGDPVTIDSTAISGPAASDYSDDFNDASEVTLAPGESTTVGVTFAPGSTGTKTGTLEVSHSGSSTPLKVGLSGEGVDSVPISFGKSLVAGQTLYGPTSLDWGPDGRLYVGLYNGAIKAYDIARSGPNAYSVQSTETIAGIQSIPNHNDDGTLNTSVKNRLITGIKVAGTAAKPVVYVSSSDPRIGAGTSGDDLNLDTNSSTISRLTKESTGWQKLELVRGLPRSEENHAANGLSLDPATNMLYVAHGGNTNKGAPSNNFAGLPEYAYSAAILSIDLDMIGSTTYDLPTLDDETRSGTTDAMDPFGGNDGRNQARLTAISPVKVHAPGFRNPYDLVRTSKGKLYTIDNGGNAGWGEMPKSEGPGGTCTNELSEPGTSDGDTLHLLSAPGHYGGHPNPTRGNLANTFNTSNPQPAVDTANPVECDYRPIGQRGELTSFPSSTNGLDEYTASNFGGALKGDLMAAGYVFNTLYRIGLNSDGTQATSNSQLISSLGDSPLDVVAQGDTDPFPGTIWVADQKGQQVIVLEPSDYGDSTGPVCSGTDDPALDEDGDGYSNADEIDNGTSPCSPADTPPDADGDKVSDRGDSDDDNDSRPDTSDPFPVDASDGLTTELPKTITWDNDQGSVGGLHNTGFTGLMTNGKTDYLDLFEQANLTVGGAAGVLTVDEVGAGDALGALNTQKNGFQFGVNAKSVTSGTFTVRTRLLAPFGGLAPADHQSMGLAIGNGDQDNYLKIVASANGGAGGVAVTKEVAGAATTGAVDGVAMPGPEALDLYLTVDPAAGTVQPSYRVVKDGQTGARTNLGAPQAIPAGWLGTSTRGLAVGILSTARDANATFPATWDFIEVKRDEGDGTPPGKTLARDTFTRTETGGLGSADLGGAWTLLAGPSGDFSVGSGKASIVTPSGAGQRVAHLAGASARDVDAKGEFSFSQAPSGSGGHFGYLVLRRQTDGSYYRVGLYLNSSGQLSIRGQNHTGTHLFSDVGTGVAYTPGEPVALRVRAEGTGPTRISARAWKPSETEPQTWQVQTSDATAGPQSAGSIGARTVNTSSTPSTVKLDELHAVDLAGTSTDPGTEEPTDPTTTEPRWESRARSGLNRQEVSYVEAGGKLYLAGGGTAHQQYDPEANTWKNVAPMPEGLDHVQGVAVGGKIYYVGGLKSWPGPHTSTVYIYDPATNSFSKGASMPRGRGAGGVAVHNGKILYAGGLHTDAGGNSSAVPWLDEYDPATNTWRQLPDMPTARDHFHAAMVGDRLYAIGGRDKEINATTAVNEAFNLTTQSWETGRKPLPTARGGFAAAVAGGEVLIMGGETGAKAHATVEAYNPATDSWRVLPSMPTARHGIQAASWNGGVYIAAGGLSPGGCCKTDVHEVFFPGAPPDGGTEPPPEPEPEPEPEPQPEPEPPPPGAAALDSFQRTVTGGFGTADAGGSWSLLSGPTSALSVDGSRGVIATPGGWAERLLELPSTSLRDLDYKAELSFPDAVSGSGAVFAYMVARRQSSGAYYRVGLVLDAAGKVLIRGQNGSGNGLFYDVDTGLQFTPGDRFAMRLQVEGSSPTKLRARVWRSGQAEPGVWHMSTSDETKGPQSAGSVGLRTINTTSSGARVEVDDVLVTELATSGALATASFSASSEPTIVDEPVQLTASGVRSVDGSELTYAWDLDADGMPEATGSRTETRFRTPGRQPVALEVTDSDGASRTVRRPIDVRERPAPAQPQPPTGGERPGATPRSPAEPKATVTLARTQRLASVLRRGIALRCGATAGTRCAARLTVSRATARRLGLLRRRSRARSIVIGARTVPAGRTVRVRLQRRARAALRRTRGARVTVTVTVPRPDGKPQRLVRRLRLKR